MWRDQRSRMPPANPALVLVLSIALLTGLVAGFVQVTASIPVSSPGPVKAAATLSVSFSYSPSTVAVNSQTQGSYSISGGSSPFKIWVNGTAPGCSPPSIPFTTSNSTGQFNCNPTSSGAYHVMVEVQDNLGNRGSTSTTLTVNNSNGNGNGNGSGNGSSSGFQLPAALIATITLFAAIFIGAIVALAAGVIATAVLLSRRLRQLNETLSKANPPMDEAKPPTQP